MPETEKQDTATFAEPPWRHLRLGREERDYIAGHALDSVLELCGDLSGCIDPKDVRSGDASNCARKIAALSNLLGDVGWERTRDFEVNAGGEDVGAILGELFPVAQLRPWLKEWQGQDTEALGAALDDADVGNAQTKLGTGALLLARIEKWTASRGN